MTAKVYSKITPKSLTEMIELINNKTISGKIAKTVFSEMLNTGKAPTVIVKEKGLVQVTYHINILRYRNFKVVLKRLMLIVFLC
jgi:Asp-tRNA(Asn)/Glu-tRNA(Gln) amidotransferase B subunit